MVAGEWEMRRRCGRIESMLVPEPRLVRAAHQFEAQMMKELLQTNDRSERVVRGCGWQRDRSSG